MLKKYWHSLLLFFILALILCYHLSYSNSRVIFPGLRGADIPYPPGYIFQMGMFLSFTAFVCIEYFILEKYRIGVHNGLFIPHFLLSALVVIFSYYIFYIPYRYLVHLEMILKDAELYKFILLAFFLFIQLAFQFYFIGKIKSRRKAAVNIAYAAATLIMVCFIAWFLYHLLFYNHPWSIGPDGKPCSH